MSFVGIFSQNSDAVSKFRESCISAPSLDTESGNGLQSIQFPSESPIFFMALSKSDSQEIQVAKKEDGSVLVLDGEVYNAESLWVDRSRDPNHDAKQLLEAYFKYGQSCFAKLDYSGIVTIWDAEANELIVLRDPVGTAPGFYTQYNSSPSFCWSSDVTTLVDVVPAARELNLSAVERYIASGYIPSPLTMFRGVSKIPAATLVKVSKQQEISSQRYWYPTGNPPLNLQPDDVTSKIDWLFTKSLERRIGSGSTKGVLLSGGVDSKLILAVLRRRLDLKNIESFTFRYENYSGQFNESNLAKDCADHFGVTHHDICYRPSDVTNNIENFIRTLGEPFSYGLHTFKLADIRNQGIDDVLCGIGADGWFLGTRDHSLVKYLNFPSPIKTAINLYPSTLGVLAKSLRSLNLGSRGNRLLERSSTLQSTLWRATYRLPALTGGVEANERLRDSLLTFQDDIDALRSEQSQIFSDALSEFSEETDRDKFRFMSLRFFAADHMCNWTHWSGKANGIKVRSPYNDLELLNLVHKLPLYGLGKPEIRRYASTLMPPEMVNVPKLSQSIPLHEWLRGPMKDFLCDHLSESRIKNSNLFNPHVVNQLIDSHMKGEQNCGWLLWGMVSVMIWQQTFSNKVVAA